MPTYIDFSVYKEDYGLFSFPIRSYRVIDGDTVEVLLDRGFKDYKEVDVRIGGVDTPEVRGEEKSAGIPVTAVVQQWFDEQKDSSIYCIVTHKGKYAGRCIGDFMCEGQTLSQYILANQLAHVYNGQKREKFTEEELIMIGKRARKLLE